MSPHPGYKGRVLALDVGERRVGIALSDPSGTIAKPLRTVPQHPRPAHFAEIGRLVSEYNVSTVVVGDPISLDGTEGPQTRRIRRYQAALAAAVPVEIVAWDERYSTATARELMREARGWRDEVLSKGRLGPAGNLDAAAAAVILQGYLDAQRQRIDSVCEVEGAGPSDPDSEGSYASFD